MEYIKNPIIRGFNPDPSIIRVNSRYYIATSTFEWFPGIQIHVSTDLEHWTLLCHPLNDTNKLNMLGNPDSGGIYAPCLTYDKGTYYLVYTDVKNLTGRFWDCSNYLITASQIEGPWSTPIYLNGSGIDPSLFHDDNGRKWLTNVVLSHHDGGKAGFPKWDGIALQELSLTENRLIGKPQIIYRGSSLGTTEGPHLYKHGGYYYLLTAEGGTFYNHAVSMARSRNLTGPYETDPDNPVMTARYDCTLPLQRTGHGDLVETPDGEWYMVHLCSRPLPSRGRSPMGRETGIQKVIWTKDNWLRLASGHQTPELLVPRPASSAPPPMSLNQSDEPEYTYFDTDKLSPHFQSLRIPLSEKMMSLKERPGFLRLKGHESLSSHHYQSLIARRQQDFCFEAQTALEFQPNHFQQMAGLVCYYDTTNYIYLYISHDEHHGTIVNLLINDLNRFSYPAGDGITINNKPDTNKQLIHLKVTVSYDSAFFSYSTDNETWLPVGDYVEYSKLSDEYFKERSIERFTGAFIGMCCQDFTGQRIAADFRYFRYCSRDHK